MSETCTHTVLEERPCGDPMPCQFHDKPRAQLILSATQIAEIQAVAWEKGRASGFSGADADRNPFLPVTTSDQRLAAIVRKHIERAAGPGYYCGNVGCTEVGLHDHPSGKSWGDR